MERREIIFLNSVFFVIGFVFVFAVVGLLIQVLISSVATMLMNVLRVIGGLVVIAFGIILLVSTRRMVPFFSGEHRFRFGTFENSFASSLVFGIAFAIGWTPCVGPILGSIYALAATTPNLAFLLLLAYSFGLGIPFLIAGAFMAEVSNAIKKAGKMVGYFNIIAGLFLIAVGLLVVSGYIGLLSVFLINTGNMGVSISGSLNFLIAIIAGVLTFLSPCILPLVPAYFSYIGGTTNEGSA